MKYFYVLRSIIHTYFFLKVNIKKKYNLIFMYILKNTQLLLLAEI